MGSSVDGRAMAKQAPVRVVVVDADARVRSALRTAIDGEPDLQVSGEAADADAALPLVAANRSCIALVEVVGREPPVGITALSRVAGCRVVAMSASCSARAACLVAGAIDFVLKGGDADAILSALRRARDAPR